MFEIAERFRSWLDGRWGGGCRRARAGNLEVGGCVAVEGFVAEEVMAYVEVGFAAYCDVWICVVSIGEELKGEDHGAVCRVFEWDNS